MNTHHKNQRTEARGQRTENLGRIFMCFICLIVSNIAFGYSGGTGESNNPYQIANVSDLLQLANNTDDYNKCFIMTADIDLDPCLPGGQVFDKAIIASREIPFIGIFNGDGHKILNMTMDTNELYNNILGLFGFTKYGEIKNISLENVNITSLSIRRSGGLIGSNGSADDSEYNWGGGSTISNSYVTGSIISVHGTDIGLLVGVNAGFIYNCHSQGSIFESGDIYGGTANLGGLVGTNLYDIDNSWSSASVEGRWIYQVGGLVGSNNSYLSWYCGKITDCYSIGTINAGGGEGGGLVGVNGGIIKRCFSTSDVNDNYGNWYIGGLVALNDGSIDECFSIGNINGNASLSSSRVGGLSGDNQGDINNCYSTGNISVGINSSYVGGLVGNNGINGYYGNVSHSYSIGVVTGGSQYKGGLIGNNTFGDINSCYFLEGSGPENGLGEQLTDEQMKHCGNFVGWDFVGSFCNNGPDYIWFIFEGVNYPQLAWYMGICVVPDVAGLTMFDANDKIIERDFTVGTITYEHSDTVPEGNVISQNPAPGQQECGSTVSYVASKGAWPCIIPNIAGLSMSDANSLIIDSNFAVGDISYGYSDTVPEGNVISQNPAPGPSEECDLAISYIASLGPIPNNGRVPDYDGNGIVNFIDFSIFADAWLSENSLIDLTGDNYINIYDLKIFCDYWLE